MTRDRSLETAPGRNSILLQKYEQSVVDTDQLPQDELLPVLFGLFGEVGSLTSTVKKYQREESAYIGYQLAVKEELGDVFWYFTALCRRLNLELDEVCSEMNSEDAYDPTFAASDIANGPIAQILMARSTPTSDQARIALIRSVASLFEIQGPSKSTTMLMSQFLQNYLSVLRVAGFPFSEVVNSNLSKVRGRFLEPDPHSLPTFDDEFEKDERLPDQFRIKITQRASGRCYLQWNGVFLGDPLTDNILDPDGYRFHDVFHMAHAAILHWSPTFRGLIKHKRKSRPKVDEAQDGGRAIVIEEGLTAWIFARAKQVNFFDGQDKVGFDLLKVLQQFVQGYEVEACPLRLWERAILDGYEVFRKVRENNGGTIVGDRQSRTISYISSITDGDEL